MQSEDRITIATPEGVDLSLTLAGLGSRFTAALVDFAIQGAIVVAAAFLLFGGDALSEAVGSGFAAAAFSVVLMLVIFGYDVLFEVLASGRTPGKRLTGLRVVQAGGEPVRFLTSAIRNLLRLVDILPFGYLVGSLAILLSPRNQRLGDIAAGTLVVRERGRPGGRPAAVQSPPRTAPRGWDVTAVTAEEVATVRSFLERRDELPPATRGELAHALAERLRPKVAGVPAGEASEPFLEQLVAAKTART